MDSETFWGGGSTQSLEGDAASTSLGFSKHFNFTNDLETFFFFLIGLEIAIGGSEGRFGFSPLAPCSHRPRSSEWSKSDPRAAACHAPPHEGTLAETGLPC